MGKTNGIGNGQPWSRRLATMYQSGMADVFILHFNVSDYVGDSGLTLGEYCDQVLFRKRDVVVHFNTAEGITFARPGMRAIFDRAVGLDGEPDEALAALAALTGGSAPTKEAETPLPQDTAQALGLLTKLLQAQTVGEDGQPIRAAVVIEYAETIAPNTDYATMSAVDRQTVVQIQQWAKDPAIIRSGGIVLLLTRNLADIHDSLRSVSARIEAVTIPLPTYEERLSYINYYLETHAANRLSMIEEQAQAEVAVVVEKSDDAIEEAEVEKLLDRARAAIAADVPSLSLAMSPEVLARQTAGLSRIHIEDILLRALHAGQPVTAELVSERKEEIIRSEFADVLEIMEPKMDFSLIGGHATLKAYLQNYVVKALREGDAEIAPLGVLLMGPPGTGKTVLVEALAKESGFNCIVLNMARILGQYVGNSERNLERALQAIEALSPCIVFTDEVDQKFQRGSGGGGGGSSVNSNIFSRVMEFMSDEAHRGRVVWVAATNRPDIMDAALRRPGRFDLKAPMLLPTADERPEVVRVLFRQCGIRPDGVDIEGLAAKLEGWTGAEIKALLQKARRVAGREGRRIVTQADVDYALTVVVPSTADIKLMTDLALANCSDLELLPVWARDRARDRKGLAKEVKAGQEAAAAPARRGRREL